MHFIEPRAARRIPAENRVNLFVHGKLIATAVAINISLGGLYLKASTPLPVGSSCEVAISLPKGNGAESVMAQGRVVRTGEVGTAIQFAQMLGEKTLDVIVKPSSPMVGSTLLNSYLNYFKVSQSSNSEDCERVFGVSQHTFKTISTASFLTSIPAAILPVWLLRDSIPAIPDWAKIIACFFYAAFWLLVLQPFIDLGMISALRAKASRVNQRKS